MFYIRLHSDNLKISVGLLKESVVAQSNLFRITTRLRASSIIECTSIKFIQIMTLRPKWFNLRSYMLYINLFREMIDKFS